MIVEKNTKFKKLAKKKGPAVNYTQVLTCPECDEKVTYDGVRSRTSLASIHIGDETHCRCYKCEYNGPGFVVIGLEIHTVAGRPRADVEHYMKTAEIVEAIV